VNSLLDTCVISELVRPQPEPKVVQWVADRDEYCLFLSVVTIGELHKGIAKLPDGPRRTRLDSWVMEDLTASLVLTRGHNRQSPQGSIEQIENREGAFCVGFLLWDHTVHVQGTFVAGTLFKTARQGTKPRRTT
jgi:hypothetical protein